MLRSGRMAWAVASIAVWLSLANVIALCAEVWQGVESARYQFGGWPPPVGIEYRIDLLAAFILLIVSFIGAITVIYARNSVKKEITAQKRPLFYCVFLLCFAGLLGIVSTNDIFNIYVFLEISSLATYALIAMGGNRKALTASFEYLILGTIGATFILIGIGLLYMMTGTLNISDIAVRIPDATDIRPIQAAFAFLTLGLALKIAMFPLHIWLTNAYSYAPNFISAFLSGTATKVSVYVLLRVVLTLFGVKFSFGEMPLSGMLVILAVAGIFVGSLTAVYQDNIKRMLAFSSVAQLGYVALGIGLGSVAGLTAAIAHLGNHALAKTALFMAVGCVFLRTGGCRVEDFRGIAKVMPWTMAAFVLAGLSLIGIPLTAGFVSKWALLQALIAQGLWWLVLVLAVSSLIAVIYIWKVVEAAYFQPLPEGMPKKWQTKTEKKAAKKLKKLKSARYSDDNTAGANHAENTPQIAEAPLFMLIPLWALVTANIYFGIYTDWTFTLATQAAQELFGG